jgi:hypothetical protein
LGKKGNKVNLQGVKNGCQITAAVFIEIMRAGKTV